MNQRIRELAEQAVMNKINVNLILNELSLEQIK